MAKKAVNWQKVAMQLAQRVNFACVHLSSKNEGSGGGLILNIKNGTSRHWKEYFAEALEMVPGVTVDRELLHARNNKARLAIIKARKQVKVVTTSTGYATNKE